jgi:hypothetical protein
MRGDQAQKPRLVSDRERIAALERRVDEHDEMKTQVKEIHDMLSAGRAILWFIGKISAWVGGTGGTIVIGITIWKFATGH